MTRYIGFGNARDIVVDTEKEDCPKCGGNGKLIVGKYTSVAGVGTCGRCGGTGEIPSKSPRTGTTGGYLWKT